VELAGVLPVVDGFVAIAEALRARAAGDPETYLDRRDRAARVLAAGERRTPAARLARVLLDEELRRLDATDVATLTIGPECRWFEADRDPRADVSRRKPLRRVLAALVAQHLEDPSRGVSTERLFAAGWPGERAAARSAATRVWNAIRQLRRLGLERLLTRRGEGYGFTERLRIERATE